MRILVIHEDEEFSRGLRYFLQREGHSVVVGLDGSAVSPQLGKY